MDAVAAKKKGIAFVIYVMVLAANRGNTLEAAEQVKRFDPRIERVLRSAADAGTTTDPTWAGPLTDYASMSGEFIEALRPATITGRLEMLRVPFATRTLIEVSAGNASWAGQARPKNVSAMSLDTRQLGIAKIVTIRPFTNELTKFWTPAGAELIRRSLIKDVARFQNEQFINPLVAAVPDVSPASVTFGATTRHSTGGTVAQVTADATAMMGDFVDAENDLTSGVWIMHPRTALSLSTLRDSGGARAFPGINVLGGEFLGMPVITSAAVPLVGSPADSFIVLLDASRILLADDGLITVDASRDASIQMVSDAETGAAQLISCWQNGLTAVRCERYINYARADNSAVAVLDEVSY